MFSSWPVLLLTVLKCFHLQAISPRAMEATIKAWVVVRAWAVRAWAAVRASDPEVRRTCLQTALLRHHHTYLCFWFVASGQVDALTSSVIKYTEC